MGKTMKLSIEVGLKDRASKGLQAIGGQVKGMSAGMTSSLGASGKLFGGLARGMDGLGAAATAVAPELGIPFMVLGTGLKAALSGVAAVGGLVVRVAQGIGRAFVVAAQVGGRALQGMIGVAERLARGLGIIGLAAAGAMVLVAKSSLDAAMQMEGFQAKLTTATKSAALGSAWKEWAINFAAATPFQMQEVVDSATRLLLQGFNPAELMTDIGNMAGAMNKPVADAVEAYLDAARGEWERIKEFGINPRNLVAFGAKRAAQGGIDAQTEEGAARADKALRALMRARYGGGMAQMMQTAAGQISNLQDALFKLRVAIGNMLLPVLREATAFGQEFVEWLRSTGVAEQVGAWIALAGQRVLWFGKALAVVVRQVAGGKSLGEAITGVIGEGFGEKVGKRLAGTVDNIIAAAGRLWTAITTVFTNLTGGITGDPVSFIQGIVDGIAGAMTWLTDNVFAPGRIEGIVNWLSGLVASVVKTGGDMASAITQVVEKAGGVEVLVGKIGGAFRWLVDWGKYLVGWVITNLPNMLETFGGVFTGIGDAILNLVSMGLYLKATWGVIFNTLGVVVTAAATIIGTVLLSVGKVLEGFFWAMSKMPGAAKEWTVAKDSMKVANDSLIAFTSAAAEQTAVHFKAIGSSVSGVGAELAKVDQARAANAAAGKWFADRAAGMRGWQGDVGWQGAAQPGTLQSYMPAGGAAGVSAPAQVTNNYYVMGNGDRYLLEKIREVNEQGGRAARWAPTG